jgi:uncharacterized membrane protein
VVPLLLKSAVLAAVMGGAVLGADALLPAASHGDTIPEAARLVGLVALGAGLYFGIHLLWKSPSSRS